MKTNLIKIICGAALMATTTTHGAGLIKPLGGGDSGAFIKSHNVDVVINNGFAQTTVTQIFGNNSDSDYEAIYSFPIPKKASLSEISLWINDNEVIGEVAEKEKARKIYEDQVAKGNDTAQPTRNYSVSNENTFNNRRSPGIGTGPVGPLFIGVVAWLNRRKKMAA